MPKTPTKAKSHKMDRKLISAKQEYEVDYVAKKTKKSRAAVRKAVKKVGHSRRKVEKELTE